MGQGLTAERQMENQASARADLHGGGEDWWGAGIGARLHGPWTWPQMRGRRRRRGLGEEASMDLGSAGCDDGGGEGSGLRWETSAVGLCASGRHGRWQWAVAVAVGVGRQRKGPEVEPTKPRSK